MVDVLLAYAIAAAWIVAALLVSWLIAFLLHRDRPQPKTRLVLNFAGAVILGFAGIEKVTWSTRPWQPDSPAGNLNDALFLTFSLIGLVCFFVSLILKLREPSSHKLSGG